MTKNQTEFVPVYRMYCVVPYNCSSIQQGIQALHGVVEYGQRYRNCPAYNQWADTDKTVIILNGGTTNEGRNNWDDLGSLDALAINLCASVSRFATFHEPDLNGALTAVCFLADQRVYDKKAYPDAAPKRQVQSPIMAWLGMSKYADAPSLLERIGDQDMYCIRKLIKALRLA